MVSGVRMVLHATAADIAVKTFPCRVKLIADVVGAPAYLLVISDADAQGVRLGTYGRVVVI
jgi:hypothetical protein